MRHESSNTHNSNSPYIPSKPIKLQSPLTFEIAEHELRLDKLDRDPPTLQNKGIAGLNIMQFYRKNFNKVVSGRSIDPETKMIDDFVRQSKDMEVQGVARPKAKMSVGPVYLIAQEQLQHHLKRTTSAHKQREWAKNVPTVGFEPTHAYA